MSGVFTFFENQTQNGVSDPYEIDERSIAVGGIKRLIKVTGAFDGATLSVQFDFGDDDWSTAQSYSFTEEDLRSIEPLANGVRIRCELVDAGAGTDVTAKIF